MPYDPTNPTVTGLEAARRTSAFFRTRPVPGPGPEGLLLEALSSAMRPGAAVIRRPVVDTVAGQETPLFAIIASGRRIAVVLASSEAPLREAALVLVYGTFDAVYAVTAEDLGSHSPRLASAICQAEPRLFTPGGRNALALCAIVPGGAAAARRAAGDRRPVSLHGRSRPLVRALRLNRPGEWGDTFEAALAAAGAPLALSA